MADDHPGNDPWHGVDHGALKVLAHVLQNSVILNLNSIFVKTVKIFHD